MAPQWLFLPSSFEATFLPLLVAWVTCCSIPSSHIGYLSLASFPLQLGTSWSDDRSKWLPSKPLKEVFLLSYWWLMGNQWWGTLWLLSILKDALLLSQLASLYLSGSHDPPWIRIMGKWRDQARSRLIPSFYMYQGRWCQWCCHHLPTFYAHYYW